MTALAVSLSHASQRHAPSSSLTPHPLLRGLMSGEFTSRGIGCRSEVILLQSGVVLEKTRMR